MMVDLLRLIWSGDAVSRRQLLLAALIYFSKDEVGSYYIVPELIGLAWTCLFSLAGEYRSWVHTRLRYY